MAGEPVHQALHFQDAEGGHDLRGGQAGAGDQVVDAGRLVVELAEQRSLCVGERQLGRMTDRGLRWTGLHFSDEWSELIDDVVDGLDQSGAVADQAVAASAGETIDRPWHGENLAVLLDRMALCRQRPAARRRLNHHDAQGETRYGAISLDEQV